jgi:hypothetical protein
MNELEKKQKEAVMDCFGENPVSFLRGLRKNNEIPFCE